MDVVFDSHCSAEYSSTELYTPRKLRKLRDLYWSNNVKYIAYHSVLDFWIDKTWNDTSVVIYMIMIWFHFF